MLSFRTTLKILVTLGILCIGFWIVWSYFAPPPQTPEPLPPLKEKQQIPSEKTPPPEEAVKPKEDLPRVAVVFDDIGWDREMIRSLLSLGIPVTLAILPNTPYQKEAANMAYQKHLDILLHLPMEPRGYPGQNPGPGALLTAMDRRLLMDTLRKDLDQVPHVMGVNNHMGSRFTEDREHMEWLLSELKARRLAFLDSRTTPRTLGYPLAKSMGLSSWQRDIFLDHEQGKEAVSHQLDQLSQIAQERRSAIAIAHPHPQTYLALKEAIPALKKKVRFVKLSDLSS